LGFAGRLLPPLNYMTNMDKKPELRQHWQRACKLILAKADVIAVNRALELALFMDAKLDVSKVPADRRLDCFRRAASSQTSAVTCRHREGAVFKLSSFEAARRCGTRRRKDKKCPSSGEGSAN
jgi:hypothetical protein